MRTTPQTCRGGLVAWRPAVFLGIGLLGYAGVSSGGIGSESRSFGGVSLAVQLGKVR